MVDVVEDDVVEDDVVEELVAVVGVGGNCGWFVGDVHGVPEGGGGPLHAAEKKLAVQLAPALQHRGPGHSVLPGLQPHWPGERQATPP